MIKVCDAVMGTGKSSAAIQYMNSHPDDKFIYITPYLNEAARIKGGCPALHFVEPNDKLRQYKFRKSAHTAALIHKGKNITTTHQAFKNYSDEMLEDIKRHGYTLIVDENVDVLGVFDFHPDDLQLAIDSGYVKEENGVYSLTDLEYKGSVLKELFTLLKTRELFRAEGDESDSFLYWALPPDLFTSFKDVFVLTYLFKGQSLHHFMEMYNIPYSYIGIEKTESGGFKFGEYPGYTPEYVYNLKDRLHILDNEKMNSVGDGYFALSMNWYDKDIDGVEQLRRNVYNCFHNMWGSIPAEEKLWGSFNDAYTKIKGMGYTKSFLTFNAKATNAYRSRKCLVYIVNLFMNVNEKTLYEKHGINVDEDMFALSIMVQWIWRSAIRDGNEVSLYIPSSRMRGLLTDWIDKISKGGNTIA